MQKLTLKSLKISISTKEGEFGQCLKFNKGLNIIRAENTSGKMVTIKPLAAPLIKQTVFPLLLGLSLYLTL